MKPALLYHCCYQDHGPTLDVRRVVPFRSPREPETPRLCVGPSVASCFAARLFDEWQPVHVYRTSKPTRGIAPRDVWDSLVTGERWIIPPATLVKVQTIAPEVVRLANYHVVGRMRRLRRMHGDVPCGSIRLRVCQYAVCTKVLPCSDFERSLVRGFLSILKIDDPLDFIKNVSVE